MDLPYGHWRLSACVVVYNPDKEKGIECYADSYFSSGWAQSDVNNAENFMSLTVYVIKYTGCPVLGYSML